MKKSNFIFLLTLTTCLVACGSSPTSSSQIISSVPVSSVSSSREEPSPIPSSVVPSSKEVSSMNPSSEKSSSAVSSSKVIPSESSEEENKALKFFQNTEFGKAKEMPSTIKDFTPTLFNKNSFNVDSTIELGTGVNHITYGFNLNNGNHVEMHTVQVDTSKAQIRSTNAATIATVNSQITKFEEDNPDVKVMAGINADFFPTGSGGTCVNAYVKDKKIVKPGHNDNGYYDYKDSRSDVPASNPMLLGVSGSHVRIGAIVEGQDKETTIKSQFGFSLFAAKGLETPSKLPGKVVNNKIRLDDNAFDVVDNGAKFYSEEGEKAIKIKPIKDDKSSFTYGQVVNIANLQGETFITATEYQKGYIFIFASADCEFKFAAGQYVGYTLNNDDGNFEGYSTVIGGRQSLVENGEIAPTVTLENTNGAQKTDIPRTCAGIKVDGTLVIAVCEALRYGGESKSNDDPYGVNLPELAEFMRYIGCYDALNFDGGGSTQLITSANNGTSEKQAVIRSSDYGTLGVEKNRKVYNTLLVTTK